MWPMTWNHLLAHDELFWKSLSKEVETCYNIKMGECTIVICGLEIRLSNKYVELNRVSIKS
jgi:hypothetical protein